MKITESKGPFSIYFIKQDVEHLKGKYLTTAVVRATTPQKAVTALRRHLVEVGSDDDAATMLNELLTVTLIGYNCGDDVPRVMAFETGEDVY